MVTAGELAERLGPALVLSVHGDAGRHVSGLTVADPAYAAPLDEGMCMIVIGHDDPVLTELHHRASESGAAALMVKGDLVTSSLDPTSDVAVLSIDPEADWAHVIAVSRVAISDVGPVGSELEDSLFAVADALSALCGGSVVIHDPSWQLLAYSGGGDTDQARTETLLGRRVPQEPFQRLRDAGIVDRILRGEIVHIAPDEIEGLGERYAAAVLVGGRHYGSIWVIPGAGRTDAEFREGLGRSVEIAALALLRHLSVHGPLAADYDTALAALLGGARTERIVTTRLGVDADSEFAVAGLRPTVKNPVERAATSRRLVGLTRSYCEAYRVPALTALIDDVTYLLFPCADVDARDRATRVLNELSLRLHRTAAHRTILSSTFTGLASAAAVRTTVDELLDLIERDGRTGVTDFAVVQSSWRLARFREVALAHPMLLEGPIMQLVEHDRANKAGYVETLRAYFDSVGDIGLAAERLHIHANTVRYRLGRVAEITSLRLDDPHDRLLTELQVRLLTD